MNKEHSPKYPLLWFGLVGVAGLVVDVAVLMALRENLGVYGARLASFVTAASCTWVLNRTLTFAHRSSAMGLWGEYARYMGLMLGGGLVNYLVYSLLALRFSQTPVWLATYVGIGSLAGMAINYLGTSRWLYRSRKNL